MSRIKILPAEIAHKIAAGEVIERPASVVKELVENAIDAQATQIVAEVRQGGVELIRVQDNGVGIERQDLDLAFQSHATSKIATENDLFSLISLGFRGEALPSIASVAKITLSSRPLKQEHGFKISNEGGHFRTQPIGSPPGTVVEVRDLFYNVPARLKFLKTAATERRRIVEMATNLALAHPHISFRLVAEGKTVLSTPGNGRLLDTILVIQGRNITKELIKFATQFKWGQIQGYLGSPQLAKGNRSGQILIVNGRVVRNNTLRAALEKGYHGLLPRRSFPWAVLIVDMDPALVDCNVHPAKAEVRFADEEGLFSATLGAVRTALRGGVHAPSLQEAPAKEGVAPKPKPIVQAQLQWEPETWEFMDELLRKYRPQPAAVSQEPFLVEEPQKEKESAERGTKKARQRLLSGRIIGQLHKTYILLEVEDGLWILDQHIVHERILYERLKKSWLATQIHVQSILPQVMEFTPSEATLVEDSLPKLGEFGLELEVFGQNSFLLRSVPSILAGRGGQWQQEILEMAENVRKEATGWQEDVLTRMACTGAIKAGEHLEKEVLQTLLRDLAKTENPFTCPHGRPIIVRLENKELLRRFGRT